MPRLIADVSPHNPRATVGAAPAAGAQDAAKPDAASPDAAPTDAAPTDSASADGTGPSPAKRGRLRGRLLVCAGLVLGVIACVDGDAKGPEDDELGDLGDLDPAKDDSFQRPTEHGAIAYDVPANATLARTARFHAWDFDVLLPGQTPTSITTGPQTSGGAAVDTVVYLYRKQANGRWGSYIAKNDDAGDSLWSELSRSLAAGQYRIIVKGYAATTYGDFAATLRCDRYACSPTQAATCIFGDHYDHGAQPDLAVTLEATFGPASDTTQLIRDQILIAARLHLPDVAGMTDLLNRVTDNEVRRVDVVHTPTRREFSFYTFILGDHRFGAAFWKNTTQLAVEIEDSVYVRCDVF